MREMIDLISEVTGYGPTRRPVSAARRPGDPARVVASADRIPAELGWSARYDVARDGRFGVGGLVRAASAGAALTAGPSLYDPACGPPKGPGADALGRTTKTMRATSARANGQRQQPVGEEAQDLADRPAAVRSGPWLLPGHDGRLLAYAQVDQAVLRWTERRPGGPDWLGPDVLPAKGLSHLTVAQGRNRYAHLLGRRVRPAKDGSLTVDLVYAIQYQVGRPIERVAVDRQPARQA